MWHVVVMWTHGEVVVMWTHNDVVVMWTHDDMVVMLPQVPRNLGCLFLHREE